MDEKTKMKNKKKKISRHVWRKLVFFQILGNRRASERERIRFSPTVLCKGSPLIHTAASIDRAQFQL
jgi:hypothetical protein